MLIYTYITSVTGKDEKMSSYFKNEGYFRIVIDAISYGLKALKNLFKTL
jgi:hypothetical protein